MPLYAHAGRSDASVLQGVQLATPEPTRIRKDAEEKLEGGAILNSGFVKNFCLALGLQKKRIF
jgi:hypothetical protein